MRVVTDVLADFTWPFGLAAGLSVDELVVEGVALASWLHGQKEVQVCQAIVKLQTAYFLVHKSRFRSTRVPVTAAI
jgi:hypothetical protein